MSHRHVADADCDAVELKPKKRIRKPRGAAPAAPLQLGAEMIEHILLATNGSPTSRTAEDHALQLAARFQAKLTVVHVEDDRWAHYGEVDHLMSEVSKEQFVSHVNRNNHRATRQVFDNFGRKAAKRGVVYDIVVASGAPERQIVGLAQDASADLVVIGRGTRSTRRFARPAGIAGKIAKDSPCSVFAAA